MKKFVRFFILVLALALSLSLTVTAFAETPERDFNTLPDDGVDWKEVDFSTLQEEVAKILGFVPHFRYSSAPSGYGSWEIFLPDDLIQIQTFYTFAPGLLDSGKHWMSSEAVANLLGGQLDKHCATLRDKLLSLYPDKMPDGNIDTYAYEDIVVVLDDDGRAYVKLDTDATEFIRELKYFRILPNGLALVDGNEISQCVYDAWATWAIR